LGKKFFPGLAAPGYNGYNNGQMTRGGPIPALSPRAAGKGRRAMSKKVVWLIIIFTILFIIGVNSGEVAYLMNLGSTI
jgi:hypothetical protein